MGFTKFSKKACRVSFCTISVLYLWEQRHKRTLAPDEMVEKRKKGVFAGGSLKFINVDIEQVGYSFSIQKLFLVMGQIRLAHAYEVRPHVGDEPVGSVQ